MRVESRETRRFLQKEPVVALVSYDVASGEVGKYILATSRRQGYGRQARGTRRRP
jgi:hypothetical protein